MFNHQLFAASLDAYLAPRKLSLRDAAKLCGVSASTLSRLVHGEVPDLEVFDRLCVWMRQEQGMFFTGVADALPETEGL